MRMSFIDKLNVPVFDCLFFNSFILGVCVEGDFLRGQTGVYIVNLLISIHNLDKIKTLFNYYCTALIGCYDASELVKELEIV